MVQTLHVIESFETCLNTTFNPKDIILTFDLVSFYTKLKIDFLNDKLEYLYNLFKNKFNTESNTKYRDYMNIVLMIKDGYKSSAKYCTIKIDDDYYIQKQSVIMGASFAPNLANLSILIHLIQNEIYEYKYIKLNIRMVDGPS